MTIPNIDINMILSDQLLFVGVCLVIFGPLLFLFSFIKFLRTKTKPKFVVPEHHPIDDEIQPAATPAHTNGRQQELSLPDPQIEVSNVASSAIESDPEPAPEPLVEKIQAHNMGEETIVMPPYVSELQAQLEIIITQIKQLNKRIVSVERQIEEIPATPAAPTASEFNELKEPPMDANDFTKKLLKLVEHVIVLEKEVDSLKSSKSESPATDVSEPKSENRPPVMPI